MFRKNVISKSNWRFYIYSENGKNFCFDSFTHKIYTLSDELKKMLEQGEYWSIKHKFNKFYSSVINVEKFYPSKLLESEKKCCITINFSNNCTLNCAYCYRNKNEKSKLDSSDAEKILKYALEEYMPDADSYSFTGCMTSESSLDLDYLKSFDSAIAKYEGYLFTKEVLQENKAADLFSRLPDEIKEKYYLENSVSYFDKMNQILFNEKLWNYYDYSENSYLNAMFKTTDKLSVAKSVTANRQILNKAYPDLNIESKIKNISIWFMTNGTHITEEYINFLKSIFMDTVMVSIDGPEEIHNYSRKYHDGSGSFNDVLKGIRKLQCNGIKVSASVVITPKYPCLLEITEYLISLGIEKVSFNLARGLSSTAQFSKDRVDLLLGNFRKIYDKVYKEAVLEKYMLTNVLKDTMLFSFVKEIYHRAYRTTRCNWGKEVVIDSKGNMYHCNSTVGCNNDLLGNYMNHVKYSDVNIEKSVDEYERCKKCFAKYLCGGTCYAEDILGNQNNFDLECYYRKELVKLSLKFYARLHSNALLEKFMEAVS